METAHRIHGCCEGEAGLRTVAGSSCGFRRRFITEAERREALGTYRTQLQRELPCAEERLEKLGN